MYIAKIKIQGFRNFKDTEIEFHEGTNVIIGPNNAGKSNLIHALRLVLDTGRNINKKLGIFDFCHRVRIEQLKENPPRVTIQVVLKHGKEPDEPDEVNMISHCMLVPSKDYDAFISYEFFLPDDKIQYYNDLVGSFTDNMDINDAWKKIENEVLRYYVYRIWEGDISCRQPMEMENLRKFDFQFLDAIRDINRDMSTGHTQMMKEILNFFIDYKIKIDKEKGDADKKKELDLVHEGFVNSVKSIMSNLMERLKDGKKEMLGYAEATGAAFNGSKPDLDGSITESDLFAALNLIVRTKDGLKILTSHNGLGYNNLIYISLLLAKMQADSDGSYMGENAKVFPILAIEEPEAHLHPELQYQFLKYLKDEQEKHHKVKQIFITTHSTQITSAVSLDEMICLYTDDQDKVHVGYPGKVFPDTDQGRKSKKYVQRFLDATKSDMLFAKRIIFVEGMAESLLLSVMAEYAGNNLQKNQVAIVNVGGRYFGHFLSLFDQTKSSYAIPVKVACITDQDPVRKRKDKADSEFERCYPYEYGKDTDKYDYQQSGQPKVEEYQEHPNIRYFSQDKMKGKTFEYDLMFGNSSSDLLLTENLRNKKLISRMMKSASYQEALDELGDTRKYKRIEDGLKASDWNACDKRKALLSSIYLRSVGKGENALELSLVLADNLALDKDARKEFNTPKYIKEAIKWVLS